MVLVYVILERWITVGFYEDWLKLACSGPIFISDVFVKATKGPSEQAI